MRIGNIKLHDISNGPGIRTSIYVTGCTHACPGCFNAEIQPRNTGRPYTKEDEQIILNQLSKPYMAGVTLLGGEPMQNTKGLIPLCHKIREIYGETKTIWCYSGYTYNQILHIKSRKQLLDYCDILIDGKYEQDKHIPTLDWRGSTNQQIIDVQQSYKKGHIVLYNNGQYI